MKHRFLTPERTQHKLPIEFAGSFAVAVEHRRIVIEAKKGQLNQGEKLLKKQLREKALTSENYGDHQRTKHPVNRVRSKQNVIAAETWSLYFQVLCFNVFQFQLTRNVFHRYDDEFFVRNLESRVDKASNGASHQERIRHLHCCTWAQQIFAFFFARVSCEILSKESSPLFSMIS